MFLEYKLTSRGISRSLASAATQAHTKDRSELARAIELARRSTRPGDDALESRRRIAGVLARRGFDAETTLAALETVLGAPPESAPTEDAREKRAPLARPKKKRSLSRRAPLRPRKTNNEHTPD
jgi:hypothetical protein